MECRFCGTSVPENGVFCPNCGKRADGKKACPSCKTLIDESAIYCAFCGTRTDGKNVCEKCGTVFEGKFCHVCGAEIVTIEEQKGKNYQTKNINNEYINNKTESKLTTFGKVERILSPTFLLVSMVALFICSFFIGVVFQVSGDLGMAVGNYRNLDVFYFFSNVFKDISAVLENENTLVLTNFMDGGLSLYIPAMLCLITAVSNIIVTLIMLILASVKYGKAISNGKEANIFKYLKWPLILFIITTCSICAYNYTYLNAVSVSYSSSTTTTIRAGLEPVLTTGAIFGLILTGVLIFASIVLRIIKNGKQYLSVSSITSGICNLIGFVVIVIAIKLITSSFISINYANSGSYGKEEIVVVVSSSFLLSLMRTLLAQGTILEENAGSFYTLSIISFVCFVVLLILLSIILTNVLRNLLENKEKYKQQTIFSSICVGFAILYTICSLILPTLFNIESSRGPTHLISGTGYIPAILCLVVLGLSIAGQIVAKKTKKPEEII